MNANAIAVKNLPNATRIEKKIIDNKYIKKRTFTMNNVISWAYC